MLRPVEDNPYASPALEQVEAPLAPASRGWQMEDGRLFVEVDAILPTVDPYTGETGEDMKPVRIAVSRRVLWPGLFLLGSILCAFGAPALGLGERSGGFGFLLALLGVYLCIEVPARLGQVGLLVFLGPRHRKRNRIMRWSLLGSLLLVLGMAAGAAYLPGFVGPFANVIYFVFAVAAADFLLLGWMSRALHWRPTPDGRRELRNVRPQALVLLSKETPPPPSSRSASSGSSSSSVAG